MSLLTRLGWANQEQNDRLARFFMPWHTALDIFLLITLMFAIDYADRTGGNAELVFIVGALLFIILIFAAPLVIARQSIRAQVGLQVGLNLLLALFGAYLWLAQPAFSFGPVVVVGQFLIGISLLSLALLGLSRQIYRSN